MKNKIAFLAFMLVASVACKSKQGIKDPGAGEPPATDLGHDFTLAFGSCNKQDKANYLWDDIIKARPDVWVWGGDNIYADTDNMEKLRGMYAKQKNVKGYARLLGNIPVIGTWDDHDYGVNDGGTEFAAKKESQQEFLDFMGVPKNSPRRRQEGVHAVHDHTVPEGKIRIIVLDTRYFRTPLTPDNETKKRNKPNKYGEGTVLGEDQWKWLEEQLKNSDADFNIIVSSIQVLSAEHGFETWGNFPHEADRLKELIASSGAKATMILSGDRHISEFSRTNITGLGYPLIDFTSSGLTHAYDKFSGEPNRHRVGKVVATESFGLLRFNFEKKEVLMQIVGNGHQVLGQLQQKY